MSSDQQNTSYIKFVCTSCNATFKLPAKYAGRKCKCKCGKIQQIPSMPSDAAVPSATVLPRKQQNIPSNYSLPQKVPFGYQREKRARKTGYGSVIIGTLAVAATIAARDSTCFMGLFLFLGLPGSSMILMGLLCILFSKPIARFSTTLQEEGWEQKNADIIRCPVCGKVYSIGKDAAMITMADALSFMIDSGTVVTGSPNAIARILNTPVLVGPYCDTWTADILEERKRETQQNLMTIRQALRNGNIPQWQCHQCMQKGKNNAHAFPKDW